MHGRGRLRTTRCRQPLVTRSTVPGHRSDVSPNQLNAKETNDNILQVHGSTNRGSCVLKPQLRRSVAYLPRQPARPIACVVAPCMRATPTRITRPARPRRVARRTCISAYACSGGGEPHEQLNRPLGLAGRANNNTTHRTHRSDPGRIMFWRDVPCDARPSFQLELPCNFAWQTDEHATGGGCRVAYCRWCFVW
jgi:hypothetical protein